MKKIGFVVSFACVALAANVCVAEKSGRMEYGGYYDVNNEWVDTKWCTPDPNKCSCLDNAPSTPQNSCVQVKIDMGRTRYSAISDAIMLQMNELNPTTAFYSPSGFRIVFGEGVYGVSRAKTAGGVPKWVYVVASSGARTTFVFADGESVGMPTGTLAVRMSGRLVMVDANGWATASDPAYYDYYPGDGSRWRFGAARSSPDFLQFVEHQAVSGRTETSNDIGVEAVRDEDGVLLQVRTPSRLANFTIVGQDAYDLTVYPNDASCLSGARAADGRYEIVSGAVPEVVWKFRNPNPGTPRDLDVTVERPGADPQTWRYEYKEAVRDFTLKSPGNQKEERLERFDSDDGTTWALRRTIVASDGTPFKVSEQRYRKNSSGSVMVASVRDPGGLNLTTTYDYFTGGTFDGLECLQVSEDGSWTRYEYDSSKRVATEIRPWLDAPTNAPLTQCAVTRYSYSLFAPGDFLAYNDQRPRIETEEVCGVEISRTYHAYPTNALGQAQEIEERAAFPGAPYGHVSNPRTVKTCYAATASLPLPGRLATVVYPGGKTETCGYEYGAFNASTFVFTPDPDGGAWRETVTTTYSSTLPSSLLTLPSRSVRVWDEKGREVLNESYVEDGTSFALIGWTRMSYDRNGKLIETAYSDGRVVSATWGANCCGKESETSAEGLITVYGYNELKQKVSETKKGFAADGSGDITTLYTYDLANRVLSTAVTNIASGLGYVASRSAYDVIGRVTNAIDRLGNATVTAYDTLATTVQRPNGVTAVTERYLNGTTKRVLENGVVKQSYAYGVNPDGTRWTLSAAGSLPAAITSQLLIPNSSLLTSLDFPWSLSVSDPLNHLVAQHKPGFSHAVLVTSNAYDIAGNLLSFSQLLTPNSSFLTAPTLYSYAANGSLYLSALDLNTNGVIDLAGPDRITGTSSAYEKGVSSLWWQVSLSWVYPEFNSSAAVTTSVLRVQLTGLGVLRDDDSVLASHSETLDVRGNATASEVLVDRMARKVTQITVLPTSVQPQVQVNVNGLLQKTESSTAVTNTFGYDALDRQITSIDGRGNTTVTAYNTQGLVAYTEDAATNRTFYIYDSLGRRTEVTDALGNVTHTQYDAEGRVTKTWGATYPVEYVYDSWGRMVSMKTFRDENGEGDTTSWLYENPTGLLTNKLYADGKGPSYTYTPSGQLAARTWARLDPGTGEKLFTLYAYDAAGSLFSVDYSDSTPDVAYTFDRLGRKLSAISTISTNLFAYSPQTLDLVAETQNGTLITRSVDAFGRSAGLGMGDNYAVTYGYDDLGRFSSVSSSVCFVSSVVNYSRFPGTDLLTGYTLSSPVSNFQFQVSKTYELHRDLITSVSNHVNHVNPVLISTYDYANDALGRRVSRRDSGLAFAQSQPNTFGYNQRSEVTNAVIYTNSYCYGYDSIGNRLFSFGNVETNTYVANILNQYSNITSQSYNSQPCNLSPTYDADGNMTFSGDGWFYTWNGENRLILASNAQHVVSYAYDHQGRMGWKTIDSITCFRLWDNYNIIGETIKDDLLPTTNYYAWGLGLSGALQFSGGIGGLLYVNKKGMFFVPVYDSNGNVTEYVDSDGAIVAQYEYSPFGEIISQSGDMASEFTHRFSTKPFCPITRLNEYEIRKYKPDIGRWINHDPQGEKGGENLYAACNNNLINSYDLIGLEPTGGVSVMGPSNCNGYLVLTALIDTYAWTYNWPRIPIDPSTGKVGWSEPWVPENYFPEKTEWETSVMWFSCLACCVDPIPDGETFTRSVRNRSMVFPWIVQVVTETTTYKWKCPDGY